MDVWGQIKFVQNRHYFLLFKAQYLSDTKELNKRKREMKTRKSANERLPQINYKLYEIQELRKHFLVKPVEF